MSKSNYSLLDRLFHRLALNFTPIVEISFEIDQRLVRADPADIIPERHVFVSGLARAGTTVLMRRFHVTGAFRSLTYREMPFVLAPNLWRRMRGSSRQDIAKVERAHGDGVLVDADSPESLDEVFWRIFTGEQYIQETHLRPYSPDDDTIRKFVCYVNAVLASQPPGAGCRRYLSKDNNNILRLRSIRRAFPNALILIPVRDPLHHAKSLLRQHLRISEMQSEDSFVLSYMTWLAHYEFGIGHRPFWFRDSDPFAPSTHSRDTLDYWLELWCETYSWLERTKPEDAIFVCYEDLCTRAEVWKRLADLAEIPASAAGGEPLRLSNRPEQHSADSELIDRASEIYGRLSGQASSALF